VSGELWLRRYLDGDRDAVWQEMRLLGDRVRDPRYAGAAQQVCDEAARRARRNIELIVERLDAQGYRFHANDDGQTPVVPFVPATSRAEQHLAWIEATVGSVPMILSSWIRLVGDVWLVGTHPEWESSPEADPLVVEVEGTRYGDSGIHHYLLDDYERWREGGEQGLFQLPLAPDQFHKANIGGGGPYGIVIPDQTAEGWFTADVESSFVAYLRTAFRYGGFPRSTADPGQWTVIHSLSQGLSLI